MFNAPDKPNVYTDGALKNPQVQAWCLGGLGIWWPGRDLDNHPCTQVEDTFSTYVQEHGGVSLWGSATGHRSSSTRTELAAGIVAATNSIGIHQGSDSMAYVKKFNQIRDGDFRPKRPWNLQTDGDLWEILDNILKGRGPASLKVSWCKGHATQKHIDENKTSVEKKAGNDMADVNATKGVEDFMPGLLQLAT